MDYFPKEPAPGSARPTPGADASLTNYFTLLAELPEVGTEDTKVEQILLLLSTCRNCFLTANAVFVDLCLLLHPDPGTASLRSVVHQTRSADAGGLRRALREVGYLRAQCEIKLSVWDDRRQLW